MMMRVLSVLLAFGTATGLSAQDTSGEGGVSIFGGGPERTGSYSVDHGGHLRGLAWRHPTRGMVVASPAIHGDRVFVGSGDGTFRSIDRATGEVVWSVELGRAVSSTAAVRAGRVHVVDRKGTLHTLDRESGSVLWKRASGPPVPFPWGHESGDHYTPSPLLLGDSLVTAGTDGVVRLFDGESGRELWSVDLGARIVASPAAGPRGIFVADASGRLTALDRSGRTLWSFETRGAGLDSSEYGFDRRTIQSSPAVAEGLVVFGSRDGTVYALDTGTGEPRWRADDHGTSWINTSPAIVEGTVVVGSSDAAFVHALDLRTGEELWRREGTGAVWSSPAVAGDVVYFGNLGGTFRALDRHTGRPLWLFPTDGMILSSPVVSGELVVFGSADGGVYALRTGSEPRERYVFREPTLERAARVNAESLAGALERYGYESVDGSGLVALLEGGAEAPNSVLVFATDHIPSEAAARALRDYLDRGGKVVWPGGPPPLLWPLDPETGRPGAYGDVAWGRTSRLLGVDHDRAIFDPRGVRATAEGRRWGLEGWWRQAWGVDPSGVTRVLGYDDWGLAASWVKEYGGEPGSGFVLVPSAAGAHGMLRAAESRPVAEDGSRSDSIVARYLRRIEDFGFSGVVLVARGDTPTVVSAHGLANRADSTPFTESTVFSLGSITKVYTATALLRLIDRGEISLGDTLGAFVPDLSFPKSGITLEQLLTHSGGVGDSPLRDVDAVDREELLEEFRRLPLVADPGQRYRYSNLGYSLLGVVLEEATGLPYEQALRREVLNPIGADDTGYVLADWSTEGLAVGYSRGDRWGTIVERFSLPDGPGWILRANGGLHTTIRDAFAWVRATVAGGLLSDSLAAAAMRPQAGRPNQGYGWALGRTADGARVVEHDGSNGIHSAIVRFVPEDDLTLIVASSVAELDAVVLGETLLRAARGDSIPMPPPVDPQPLTGSMAEAFAGRWEGEDGTIRATSAGDHITLAVEGQDLVNLVLDTSGDLAGVLAEDTRRARELMELALAGDFEAEPVIGRVWQTVESEIAPIEDVEVLGSAPVWYASVRASWIRLHFSGSDRTQIRRLHWTEDGELYGIGGSLYTAPVELRCVPTAPDECTAAHLVLPIAEVRFRTGPDEGATLVTGGRSVELRRTGG